MCDFQRCLPNNFSILDSCDTCHVMHLNMDTHSHAKLVKNVALVLPVWCLKTIYIKSAKSINLLLSKRDIHISIIMVIFIFFDMQHPFLNCQILCKIKFILAYIKHYMLPFILRSLHKLHVLPIMFQKSSHQ